MPTLALIVALPVIAITVILLVGRLAQGFADWRKNK